MDFINVVNIISLFEYCSIRNVIPEDEGNIEAFKFSLVELHNQPLPRLTSESCFIHLNNVDLQMNSKAEWHQPTVGRVVVTRELQELEGQQEGGRAGQGGGRARRRGGG